LSIAPIIAYNYSIWVHDRNDQELKDVSESVSKWIFAYDVIDEAVNNKTGMSFTRVLTTYDKYCWF
jgi:hypothetical protein